MTDVYDFTQYGSDPWHNITQDERPWYDPVLRESYRRNTVYSPHAQFKVDLNGPVARTIYFDDIIPPRPNIAPIDNRAMNATRLYTDSYRREVTTQRYGNGVAIHRESSMFSYWKKNGLGTGKGIWPIIQQGLGQAVTDHIDLLARNAFLLHPYSKLGIAGASSISSLNTTSDKMSTDVLDAVWLGMGDRSMPFQPIGQPFLTGNELICVTTRGVIYDLKREVGSGAGGLNFVDANKYTEAGRNMLYSGEIGMWRGVRFIDSQMAKLWNIGTITHQSPIKTAVKPGQGAPDPATTKVEGVRRVGQPGAKHFIEVTDASGFPVGAMVTVHRARAVSGDLTSDQYKGKAVLNGVLFDDPMAQNIEVHAVDTVSTPNRVYLKEPYMMVQEDGLGLEVDLGSTVFGYITYGQTVHTALFLNQQQQGLICGVAQPPLFYAPQAIDDYLSMHRLSYDFYMKFGLWEPRAFDLYFLTGANSLMGRGIFR